MAEIIVSSIVILAALGVILLKKPVHASLSFLLTLLGLASLYALHYAPLIAVLQILVYAGAILVIFMFVIVLFQDAYLAIKEYKARARPFALACSAMIFLVALTLFGMQLPAGGTNVQLPEGYGSVHTIAKTLYIDFFFPFEAVVVLFLVAMVGAVYIGKKVK